MGREGWVGKVRGHREGTNERAKFERREGGKGRARMPLKAMRKTRVYVKRRLLQKRGELILTSKVILICLRFFFFLSARKIPSKTKLKITFQGYFKLLRLLLAL